MTTLNHFVCSKQYIVHFLGHLKIDIQYTFEICCWLLVKIMTQLFLQKYMIYICNEITCEMMYPINFYITIYSIKHVPIMSIYVFDVAIDLLFICVTEHIKVFGTFVADIFLFCFNIILI